MLGHLRVTIVIVTYNRSALLEKLLNSIENLSTRPFHIVIVNNASTDDTAHILENWSHNNTEVTSQVINMSTNTGGAGGFHEGLKCALSSGANWFWVMDDDVEVLSDALSLAQKWTGHFDAFMGQRLDTEGNIFRWSPFLNVKSGLSSKTPKAPFKNVDSIECNTGCFEGMFISEKALREVGLPDPRFFITWDDTIYGWLVSRKFRVGFVKDIFLRRTIELKSLGPSFRPIMARNHMSRYYLIRNRAIQAKYFAKEGSLNKLSFNLGTFKLVFYEIVRSLIFEQRVHGLVQIYRGVKDMLWLSRDNTFCVPLKRMQGNSDFIDSST